MRAVSYMHNCYAAESGNLRAHIASMSIHRSFVLLTKLAALIDDRNLVMDTCYATTFTSKYTQVILFYNAIT